VPRRAPPGRLSRASPVGPEEMRLDRSRSDARLLLRAKGGSDGRHHCSHGEQKPGRSSRDSCIGTIPSASPRPAAALGQMRGSVPQQQRLPGSIQPPDWCLTPDAAVRAVSARLLLLCLLLSISWLAAEGGRQVGAARVHRRGGGTCGRVGGCGCWRSKGKASRTLVARPRITREQTLVALAAPSKSSKSASNSQFRSRWKATCSRRRAGRRPKFPQAPTSR
jgi:hypothetical protein